MPTAKCDGQMALNVCWGFFLLDGDPFGPLILQEWQEGMRDELLG